MTTIAALAKTLDRCPNLSVDISARNCELGRQTHFAAKFPTGHKGRVLFGDGIFGLRLTAPVLEALYRNNARRILNWGQS